MLSVLDDVGAKIKAEIVSSDSTPKQIKREIIDRHLPIRSGLSAELVDQIVAFNAWLDALAARCDRSDAEYAATAEKACGAGEMGEFLVGRSAAIEDIALLTQERVQAAVKGVQLADLALAELRDIPPKLEEAAEAVVAKVRKDLEKIGSSVEAQPAFPYGNLDAAERQLDHLARNVNVRSRAALAAVADARAEHVGASQTASEARQELEDAKKMLLAVARKAIAV